MMRTTPLFLLLPVVLAATPTAPQGREPALRVSVRLAQGANEGCDESVQEVRELLQQQKHDSPLAAATGDERPELQVWITRRFMTRRAPRSPLESETSVACALQATVTGNGHVEQEFTATGLIWSKAAAELVHALAEYARQRQPELLAERPDWPDLGFGFQDLTKEQRKKLHSKHGAAIVTFVRPDGAAWNAGVHSGDLVLRLNGHKLKTAGDLASALYVAAPGSQERLEVARGTSRKTLTLAFP